MLKKVLLADESKPSLILISEVLKDLFPNLAVRTARSTAEAVDIFALTTDIDLVILDLKLAGAQTIEVVKKLKTERSVPIFLTSYKTEIELIQAVKKSLIHFPESASLLEKPVEHDHLLQHMEHYAPNLLPDGIPQPLSTPGNTQTIAIANKMKHNPYVAQMRKV